MSVAWPDDAATQTCVDRQPAGLPEGARLEVVATLGALLALKEDWQALEAVAAQPRHVFQSFAWCGTWARHFLSEAASVRPALIAGWLGGRLVMLWPLMIARHGPVQVLKWLTDPFGQYGDVLVAPDIDAAPWLSRAWQIARTELGIDAAFLRHVRVDATAYPFLSASCATSIARECAPCLDLSAFADSAAYDRRYGKEQRRRRQRIQRKLEALGPVRFGMDDPSDGSAGTVGWMIAEKRRWLAARGLMSPVVADARLHAFLRDLGVDTGDAPLAAAPVLRCGDRPVAAELALRYRGGHFAYLTAHDHRLHDLSPARLHMHLSQKWCLEKGLALFDLMVPGDSYKESWSNGSVDVLDFLAPASAMGRLYCRAYLRHLRPHMRAAYLRLGRRVRRPAVALLTKLGGF